MLIKRRVCHNGNFHKSYLSKFRSWTEHNEWMVGICKKVTPVTISSATNKGIYCCGRLFCWCACLLSWCASRLPKHLGFIVDWEMLALRWLKRFVTKNITVNLKSSRRSMLQHPNYKRCMCIVYNIAVLQVLQPRSRRNIRMILKFTVLIWSTYPVYLPDQGWFKFKLKLKFKFDPPSLLTRARMMTQESSTDLISGFSEQLKSFCFQFTAIWTLKLASQRSHLQ